MACSHSPKLKLITGARLWFTMYCEESATPSLLLVDADTTNFTEALRAAAPAHSTSSVVSPCSPPDITPGSVPFTITVGLLAARPNRLLKCRYIGEKNIAAAGDRDRLPSAVAP